jgi:hypothetical protein
LFCYQKKLVLGKGFVGVDVILSQQDEGSGVERQNSETKYE